MQIAKPQVLVVGAGPTGLVLALRLAHHGIPFRIIDQNTGPGLASRAMVVQARTLEFYQQMGFADELIEHGVKIEAAHVRKDAKEMARISFQDLGVGLSPYPFALAYPQDDHEKFLVEKLSALGVTIEWQTELKAFSENTNQVQAVLSKNGSEEKITVDYLCGCDGARSRVRQDLKLDFPGGTYDQMFYVADVKITGEFKKDLFINLGAGDFAILLPVRSRGMQRLIGIVPAALKEHKDLAFPQIQAHAEKLMAIQVEQVNWFSTYHVHHRIAAHFRVGRVFLAGDAGHIHSPAGGQGMNTGIGDAINLSWKLAAVLKGQANESILDTYESERIAFAKTLVSTTDRVFQGLVNPNWTGSLIRQWVLPHVVPLLMRLSSARHFFFKILSQIHIHYRESDLSEGIAGGISGGDRLPWVPSSQNGGNFSSLTSMQWQIQIYGSATPAFAKTARALGLPLEIIAWSSEAEKAGLIEDAAYLIRPDGYVGLAMFFQDEEELQEYWNTLTRT